VLPAVSVEVRLRAAQLVADAALVPGDQASAAAGVHADSVPLQRVALRETLRAGRTGVRPVAVGALAVSLQAAAMAEAAAARRAAEAALGVVRLDVVAQVNREAERPIAQVAPVWPVGAVSPPVHGQVTRLQESLAADGTLERSLAGMTSRVPRQVAVARETPAALRAPVFRPMDVHVLAAGDARGEAPLALAARVPAHGGVRGVDSRHVGVEVLRLGERAVARGTLVRLRSAVRDDVPRQTGRRREHSSTDAAFERFLRGMLLFPMPQQLELASEVLSTFSAPVASSAIVHLTAQAVATFDARQMLSIAVQFGVICQVPLGCESFTANTAQVCWPP